MDRSIPTCTYQTTYIRLSGAGQSQSDDNVKHEPAQPAERRSLENGRGVTAYSTGRCVTGAATPVSH